MDAQPRTSARPGSITGRSNTPPSTLRPGRSVRTNRMASDIPTTIEPAVVSRAKATLFRTASHHAGSVRRLL
jgi:hypothetical protein